MQRAPSREQERAWGAAGTGGGNERKLEWEAVTSLWRTLKARVRR